MPESNSTTTSKAPEESATPKAPEESTTPKKENKLHEYDWMVRPCETYKEEYRDCTSIRARFHQYFIFGKGIECKQWKTDYHNCCLWEEDKNEEAYEELIKSERQHRIERLQGHYRNDVWEKRDKPPENWNAPLPKWLEEKYEHSYLKYMSEELKNPVEEINKKGSCTIL